MKIKSNSRIISLGLCILLLLSSSIGLLGSKAYAASVGQELWITEIMPMSQASGDAYEYFELYNNTDSSIDLKGYKLPNQNIDITSSKVIPSKGVLIICTRSNTSLEDFNTFYGTTLTEDKYMTLPFENEILSNSATQSILLAKDDGTVIIRASYSRDNFEVKKSVTYQYPQTGFDMRKLGSDQNPTPGDVAANQIPYNGVSVTGITLDKQFITMETNQTIALHATITPITASNKAVTWTSDDNKIVEVNSNGVLTSKSDGLALITAKTVDGGYTASCIVKVQKIPVTGVVLDKSNITLDIGKTAVLTATVNPINATNKAIVWSSSNSSIATVTSNGLVSGKSQGIALITVKTIDGNFTASCAVVVNPKDVNIPVTGISLSKTNVTLESGKAIILEAKIKPDNATNKQVIWSSSNTNIVTVDENGVIFAKEQGSAVITAKTVNGGYTAYCSVTVTNKEDSTVPVTGIRLNKEEITIKQWEYEKLTAIVTPDNATNKSVIWESSNPEVAIVIPDGRVIGLSDGVAIITATTKDGKYSDKCIVNVEDKKGNGKGKAKGHSKNWKHE